MLEKKFFQRRPLRQNFVVIIISDGLKEIY